jgi:tagatose 1,6-diphosphate aldolase GatY/KbaY
VLEGLSSLLKRARGGGAALVGFTCYDLEGGLGVLAAAAERRCPVALLVSARSLSEPGGLALVAGLSELLDGSPVVGCIQLDHLSGLDARALVALSGQGRAAMVDHSKLAFQQNLEATAAAVRAAAELGCDVEGELGRLEGDEDRTGASGRAARLTDVGEAARFCELTGVACLAVSVGNAHGNYRDPPRLDFELLAELGSSLGTPIALHGSSGLSSADLRAALRCGVAKLNVNTDLRAAYFAALRDGLADADNVAHLDLLALKAGLVSRLSAVADRVLAAAGW